VGSKELIAVVEWPEALELPQNGKQFLSV
jgi:hypothetical protein